MEGKGVDIQLLSFTPLENPIGETFSYNIDPHSFTENWQRGIALFIDEDRVVVGNKIGKYALIGAGAVVTKEVKAYALVVGNPSKQIGWVSEYGHRLNFIDGIAKCPESSEKYELKHNSVKKINE